MNVAAMTPGPLTVTPRTSVAAALWLARDNGIRRRPVVEPVTLPAETPLTDAARRLLARGAHEALVVEGGRLVGILTHSDLLRALVASVPEAVA